MPERRLLLALCFMCSSIAACAKVASAPEPLGNSSETHFLMRCSDDCGSEMSCVCGVCSKACSSTRACTGLSKAAACSASADDACDTARLCDVTCEHDADCAALGKGYACAEGRCRTPIAKAAAGDAGVCAGGGCGTDKTRGDVALVSNDLPAACDHYYTMRYARSDCGGAALPLPEQGRQQARFRQACAAEVALPGSGANPAAIESCASALQAGACDPWLPDACRFRGTLLEGSACNHGSQCQSGVCNGPGGEILEFNYLALAPAATCGRCAPATAIGEVCGRGGGCEAGAHCTTPYAMTFQSEPIYACYEETEGDVGATCGNNLLGPIDWCKPGLYCARDTGSSPGSCRSLAGEGEGCAAVSGPGSCQPPLRCDNVSQTCKPPAEKGDLCLKPSDCQHGLHCPTTQFCSEVQWVGAGEVCNATTRCLVGTCPNDSPYSTMPEATCPRVTADGEPCSASDTCDAFSTCIDGVCAISASHVCE